MAKSSSGRDTSTPPTALPFKQDPHKVRELDERNLEVAIGKQLRAYRHQNSLTVAELSKKTGISIAMLSKIENGNTSPSLTTLQILADALSVPITSFFRGYEEKRHAVHVKKDEALEIKGTGSRAGHQYRALGHIGANNSGVVVEPYLIRLTEESDVFPTFQHDGLELIYMLKGEVLYRHGNQTYRLKPGDSLFFDADAPHGPDKLVRLPAEYLSIISYPQ